MKKKISIIVTLVLMVSFIKVPSFANAQGMKPAGQQTMVSKDIVDVAAGDDRFETLVAALGAAGLVDTLKGNGPFTVFAPTDDAFAKLAPGTIDELLKPQNKDMLVNILTYHVTPGKVLASDAVKLDGKEVTMANGDTAKIEVRDGSVYIDGAKVIMTDIMAKNGVIHVIDTVMMPPTGEMAPSNMK